MSDLIDRDKAILKCQERLNESALNNVGVECEADEVFEDIAQNRIKDWLNELPSAEPDVKPISYKDCVFALLAMWIDNVLTAGEYNRIMDRLTAHEKRRIEDERQ